MPLVRITHMPGADADAASRIVHAALQAHFDVPEADYFHILEQTGAGRWLARSDSYLGHTYTGGFILIEITCSAGRTVEQKKALYAAITDGLERDLGLRRDDVTVVITENRREDWCFGGGVAAYV